MEKGASRYSGGRVGHYLLSKKENLLNRDSWIFIQSVNQGFEKQIKISIAAWKKSFDKQIKAIKEGNLGQDMESEVLIILQIVPCLNLPEKKISRTISRIQRNRAEQ